MNHLASSFLPVKKSDEDTTVQQHEHQLLEFQMTVICWTSWLVLALLSFISLFQSTMNLVISNPSVSIHLGQFVLGLSTLLVGCFTSWWCTRVSLSRHPDFDLTRSMILALMIVPSIYLSMQIVMSAGILVASVVPLLASVIWSCIVIVDQKSRATTPQLRVFHQHGDETEMTLHTHQTHQLHSSVTPHLSLIQQTTAADTDEELLSEEEDDNDDDNRSSWLDRREILRADGSHIEIDGGFLIHNIAPGEVRYWHVPLNPVLNQVPKVEMEFAAEDSIRVKVAECTAYGIRFEIRRAAANSNSVTSDGDEIREMTGYSLNDAHVQFRLQVKSGTAQF